MDTTNTRLAIYNTYKTRKDVITGEGERQRSIITILAENSNPTERTRTGLSNIIAKKRGATPKNVYSGIFRDLEEIFLPRGIVEEGGRLPLNRGPKALQEKGIPYYHLTRKGILIALGIKDIGNKKYLLTKFFAKSNNSKEQKIEEIIYRMLEIDSDFTYSIIEKYVRVFGGNDDDDDKGSYDNVSKGDIKDSYDNNNNNNDSGKGNKEDQGLLPFDLTKLKRIADDSLTIQKKSLMAFLQLADEDKRDLVNFLEQIL